TLGWRAMQSRAPNAGHLAVARLERDGHVSGVITQNVDGLHLAAGSSNVVELHGSLSQVVCLTCRTRESRATMQERLESLNPGFAGRTATRRPDGDAAIPDGWIEEFVVTACRVCGGVLKTDVVFFGENVPKERSVAAGALVEGASALLVLGSSLEARSG